MILTQKNFITKNKTSYSQFLQQHQFSRVSSSSETLVDVDFFRRSISLHYQHLYTYQKRQNGIYRAIFFGFSLLFLIFSFLIYFKTVNFTCGFYLGQCLSIKNYLNTGCLLLAGVAFGIGYLIEPEKEALSYLVRKVENDMHHPVGQLKLDIFNVISCL